MMDATVYFSAPGVVTAAGLDAEQLWERVLGADNACIRPVPVCGGQTFPAARIAPETLAPAPTARYDSHFARLEAAALRQLGGSIAAAKERYGAGRVAACVGTCDNGSERSVAAHQEFFAGGAFPPGYTLEQQGADYAATFIRETYGLGGAACAFATACSSSAGAIIRAAQLIKSGAADAVVAGGADIASDTVVLGFAALGAVSPQSTNPFSRNRAGISLGDGAAFFVLSRDPLDTGGQQVVLSGFAESADAHHMTSPDPGGAGAERAMRDALRAAHLTPADVGYINLHGTGTIMNDRMEAHAVNAVFGAEVPCSSTKSVTGHTLGAAGAVAAAVCYLALVKNAPGQTELRLPAQAWDGERDEELAPLCIVSAGHVVRARAPLVHCMVNSFAFGGANASLILSRRQ